MTWGFEGEGDSILAVELRPEGTGTCLVLDHRRLPGEAAAGYGAGWHLHLDALEADLRGTEAPSWEKRYPVLLPTYRSSAAAASDLQG